MRDPFAGYDNWLVRPYEEAEENARREEEHAEWEWENSTFYCDCCGETIDDTLAVIALSGPVDCPHCGETEVKIHQIKPELPVDPPDYYEDRDYYY